jgi:hypothetical protein
MKRENIMTNVVKLMSKSQIANASFDAAQIEKRQEVMQSVSVLWDIVKYRMDYDLQESNFEIDTLKETIGLLRSVSDDLLEAARDNNLIG